QILNTPRQVNRAFSYAPQTAAASPTTGTEQPQAATPTPQAQDNSARSFSYQAAPSNNVMQMNRRATRVPSFLRADRKALGNY
ncbi:MAG TPA: hypothetical protein VGZ26_12225, partial [Pirellulales bacterium]|nr:hypothetical protein [Pirellulales bacterium]